jgi:DNA-3-methyladenine glycosylase II
MHSESLLFLSNADPILESIIAQIPPPTHVSTNNIFHDLMSCVIEQQIHYRSSKGIFRKLLAQADITELTPSNFAVFEEKSLQDYKLSMAKQETIGHVLEFWNKEQVDWQSCNDHEIRRKLSAIKGIGPWTMDMLLLYTLGRPNIFPMEDYHLKKTMVSLYGLDPTMGLKKRMIEISYQWKNHKSLAVLYLLDWKSYNRSNKRA